MLLVNEDQQVEIERLRTELAVAVRVAVLGVTSIAGTYNDHTPDEQALWESFGGKVTVTAGDVRAVKAMQKKLEWWQGEQSI